jgi:hypothetical protein
MFGKVSSIESLIADLLPSTTLRVVKKITLHRKGPDFEAWVDVTSSGITVRLKEGERGSATVAVDKKKKSLRMKGESATHEVELKSGAQLAIEVRNAKGKKLLFPSKGTYAYSPARDEPKK